MKIIQFLKQKILAYKYKNAPSLYIICKWCGYGILEAKYSGKVDKEGHPLTIHFTDHNGEYNYYYIAPWYNETTGATICYTFNKEMANSLLKYFTPSY